MSSRKQTSFLAKDTSRYHSNVRRSDAEVRKSTNM